MPLVVFARFHARQGNEEAVANLMRTLQDKVQGLLDELNQKG